MGMSDSNARLKFLSLEISSGFSHVDIAPSGLGFGVGTDTQGGTSFALG